MNVGTNTKICRLYNKKQEIDRQVNSLMKHTQQQRKQINDAGNNADNIKQADNINEKKQDKAVADKNVGRMTIDVDGQKQTFSVEVSEFSDKYPDHKQYFGRYFDIKDEAGNIVARYAPYTKQLQMRDGYEHLQGQVEQQLKKNLRRYLEKGGFLDEYGRLKPDGNEEYRYKYRTRLDATPEGKTIHPNNLRGSENKREDKRGFLEKAKDTITETLSEHHIRKTIENKIREVLQKVVKAQYGYLSNGAKNYVKLLGKLYSRVLTARLANAAHIAGIGISEYYKIWNVNFTFNDVLPKSKERNRAYIEFNPAQFYEDGNLKTSASTVIHLTEFADESTILHVLMYAVLKDFQDLMTSVHDLPEQVTKDWEMLIKWLGISDIDLTKDINDFTKEERERWHNAQEQFTVGGEQYFATGQAPTSQLKQTFENFKKWFARIYGAVKNIKYMGTDGYEHEIELHPEIKTIYDRMFNSSVPFVPNQTNIEALIAQKNQKKVYVKYSTPCRQSRRI